MTTGKGTIQGMTCVTAADDKHQIIVEAKAFGVGQEQVTLKPMIENIKSHFVENIFENGCVITADTGYCSEDNLAYLHEQKIKAVIPDNLFRMRDPIYAESERFLAHKEQRQNTRLDRQKTRGIISSSEFSILIEERKNATHLDKMKKLIDSDEGRRLYSRRMRTIEPVFGNICSNKGLNKLSLRSEFFYSLVR
jgi:hypothetical protein